MAKDNITLVISAKDAASRTFSGVKSSAIALGVAIGNLSSSLVQSAVSGLRGWINEAIEAEQANVKLDAALRGLGQYTPQLSAQYVKLADAIQDETGSSDESVKNNIALLASYGVMPESMGRAARSMEALSALGVEQSMAARAVARAIDGDYEAFNRLSPAVRNATTDQEKALAINALVASGFEQQSANLHTVGGAWKALQGRMGDFREAVIGAVFEGLKLGNTFDSAQSKLGAFLKSGSFNALTNLLREMAALAKDIFTASTSDFGGTMKAIGQVIFAALSDGADVAAEKIAAALGVSKKVMAKTWHDDPIVKASRWLGSASEGISEELSKNNAPNGGLYSGNGANQIGTAIANWFKKGGTKEASRQANKPFDSTNKNAALPVAIANLKKVVKDINTKANAEAKNTPSVNTPPPAGSNSPNGKQQLISDETLKDIKENQIASEQRKLWVDGEILSAKEAIKRANEDEAYYTNAAAKYAAERAKLAAQGLAAFIKGQLGNIEKQKGQDKDDADAEKEYKRLKQKNKNTTKVSEKDKNFMEAYEQRGKLNRGLAQKQAEALKAADDAKKLKDAKEKELNALQKEQRDLLKEISDKLTASLEVQ